MLASSFCASRPRDVRRRISATELVCAARRSSDSVAAPSQQHYNLALNWSSHRRVPRRGAVGSTSRRDAAARRGGTRAARSISSVAAASAPSQQQKQATVVSRDHERSTGRNTSLGSPSKYRTHRTHRTHHRTRIIRINLPKELRSHSPDRERSNKMTFFGG
jgi:hypothetical protein